MKIEDISSALHSENFNLIWDIELLETEENADYEIRNFYMSTSFFGVNIRLFVIHGIPQRAIKEQQPAILHIHGGGQTAYVRDVKHWVNRGYSAVSYDWTGPYDGRAYVSDISGLPSIDAASGFVPEESTMLTRVLLAKAILQWMKQQETIDGANIGVYGISWGGAITWLLNRYEAGIRAVAPIYGCGDHFQPNHNYNYASVTHTARELNNWKRWLDGIDTASEQNAPLLMIAATNDFWGWMDAVEAALVQVPQENWSLTYSANQNHHLDEWAEPTLNAWMDHHLLGKLEVWPTQPEIAFELRNGSELYAKVIMSADSSNDVTIRLCWSWGDYSEVLPPSRFWHVATLDKGTNEVRIPVVNPKSAFYIYADLIYPSGLKLSSLSYRAVPNRLGLLEADDSSNEVLADFNDGINGWYCPVVITEPLDSEFRYSFITDPNGGKAMALPDFQGAYQWSTFKSVDPKWQPAPEHTSLNVRFHAAAAGEWTILAQYRPSIGGQRDWKYTINLTPGWNNIEVPFDVLKDAENKRIPSGFHIHKLIVQFNETITAAAGESALGTVKWS